MTRSDGSLFVMIPQELVTASIIHQYQLKYIPSHPERVRLRLAFYSKELGLRPKTVRGTDYRVYDCFVFDCMAEVLQFKLTHCPKDELRFITPLN